MINNIIQKTPIKKDNVVISHKEYKKLLIFRAKATAEIEMTPKQKNALSNARKNLSQKKFLTIYGLKQKLRNKN